MSIVILGGHERMERQYKNLCKEHNCEAKVITKADGGLRRKLGNPDLVVFFITTMSHKMVRGAISELKGSSARVEYSTSSSASALKDILKRCVCPEGELV